MEAIAVLGIANSLAIEIFDIEHNFEIDYAKFRFSDDDEILWAAILYENDEEAKPYFEHNDVKYYLENFMRV